MNSPVWPDWALLQSEHHRVWAVVHDYLAGREAFEPAAARLAAILRERIQEPRFSRPAASGAAERPMWMISLPVPSVDDADKPRVSRLFERAGELFGQGTDGGAA